MRFPALLVLCASPLLAWADTSLDAQALDRHAFDHHAFDHHALDQQVRAAAETLMRENAIPGLAIALTDNGQQHFYEFGVSDKTSGQAVTRDTLFELGSVSKTFTATLAGYAQAQGKLALEHKVGEYLPEFAGSPFGELSLINLATHTSGGMPLQLPDSVSDNQTLTGWLRQWQPEHPPGTWRTYANPSIGMLGVIAARQLHLPYVAAMQDTLLPALGLSNSYLEVPRDKQALYAWGYDKDLLRVRVNPGVLAAEAYGMKSSSRDLLHFVEANLGRVELPAPLKAALAQTQHGYYQRGAMTQDLIWEQYDYPLALQTLLDGNDNRSALLGTVVKALDPPLKPQQRVWLNKTGSTNGFGAYVAFVPYQQRGVVLLANRNYPNSERVKLAWRLFELLDQHAAQPASAASTNSSRS